MWRNQVNEVVKQFFAPIPVFFLGKTFTAIPHSKYSGRELIFLKKVAFESPHYRS
jgi:hypothetical protein